MAHRCSQCIGGIQNLILKIHAKRACQHSRYLLLGGIAVAGYGLFDFFWRIFYDRHPLGDGSRNGYALGATQFEHGLDIFAKKRCLDGHLFWLILPDNFLQLHQDSLQSVGVLLRTMEMHDAEVQDIQRLAMHFEDGEAEHAGAGVHAEDAIGLGFRFQMCIIAAINACFGCK